MPWGLKSSRRLVKRKARKPTLKLKAEEFFLYVSASSPLMLPIEQATYKFWDESDDQPRLHVITRNVAKLQADVAGDFGFFFLAKTINKVRVKISTTATAVPTTV